MLLDYTSLLLCISCCITSFVTFATKSKLPLPSDYYYFKIIFKKWNGLILIWKRTPHDVSLFVQSMSSKHGMALGVFSVFFYEKRWMLTVIIIWFCVFTTCKYHNMCNVYCYDDERTLIVKQIKTRLRTESKHYGVRSTYKFNTLKGNISIGICLVFKLLVFWKCWL